MARPKKNGELKEKKNSGSRQRNAAWGHKDAEVSLDIYLKEIGKTPLLSREEEKKLARRAREGDEDAIDKLARANLRFVVSIARQYQSQGLSLSDLINEGNMGLLKAVRRFDETRGYKFISYAVWWIRQAILQALAEQSRVVRLPLNRVATLCRIGRAASLLEQKGGRQPSQDEIADSMDLPVEEVSSTMKLLAPPLSLDVPFAGDRRGDHTLLDIISDEEAESPDEVLLEHSLRVEIEKAVELLPNREAEVIRLYFGLDERGPLTLEDIGIRFNLTRERVRQIKEAALRRLRHPTRSQTLRSFVD